jgi:hypothetical protein
MDFISIDSNKKSFSFDLCERHAMFFLQNFFILILLPIVIASPQINLYFTDSVSNKPTDVLFLHQKKCSIIVEELTKKID